MSPNFEYTHDASRVLKLLKKKKRTWAKDLDTTVEFMKYLAEYGLVKADGPIKTGKPGKPPVAWKFLSDDLDLLPEFQSPKQAEKKATSQATIDAVIESVRKSFPGGCGCILSDEYGEGTTEEQVRAFNEGCTTHWVCPALDAVRRRANLRSVEQPFVEVI